MNPPILFALLLVSYASYEAWQFYFPSVSNLPQEPKYGGKDAGRKFPVPVLADSRALSNPIAGQSVGEARESTNANTLRSSPEYRGLTHRAFAAGNPFVAGSSTEGRASLTVRVRRYADGDWQGNSGEMRQAIASRYQARPIRHSISANVGRGRIV